MAGSPSPFFQKTAVITGASAGVGRAAALRFARAGAKLALIARDADALNDVRREVESCGASAMTIALDVADPNAVLQASDTIVMSLGSIDVWINKCHGYGVFPGMEDHPGRIPPRYRSDLSRHRSRHHGSAAPYAIR
jgi:short-subunit dehydrogenase